MQAIFKTRYDASWALIIGVNQYQNASPLRFARNDAEAVAQALSEKFGFPKSNIRLLTAGQAIKDNIWGAYLDFAKSNIGADDRLLVFFAGHGLTKTGYRGEVGYLVPADGNSDEPQRQRQ